MVNTDKGTMLQQCGKISNSTVSANQIARFLAVFIFLRVRVSKLLSGLPGIIDLIVRLTG